MPSTVTKVAVYNASERYGGYTTGVGKHVKHMVAGLAKESDFGVNFWVPSDYWREDLKCPTTSQLWAVKSSKLPLRRRALAALSLFAGVPTAEHLFGDIDWVYLPREVLVRTKHAKIAVTVHDVYAFEPAVAPTSYLRNRLAKMTVARSAAEASAVITVSEFSKNRICELFLVSPNKVFVVGNGVEQCFFDVADLDPLAVTPRPGMRYFLTIGGLTKKKGGRNLVRLASILKKQAVSLSLVVIGGVDPEFRSEVNAAGNMIVIAPGVDDGQMALWIRGAVAVVMLSEYEGFGIPVLEAMAAGVPVIASNRGALPEVVADAGLVVEPNRLTELEAAVGLWKDRPLQDELVARGRKRAEAARWEGCVSRLADLLRGNQGEVESTASPW